MYFSTENVNAILTLWAIQTQTGGQIQPMAYSLPTPVNTVERLRLVKTWGRKQSEHVDTWEYSILGRGYSHCKVCETKTHLQCGWRRQSERERQEMRAEQQ